MLAGGDEAARLNFATDHVGPAVADLPPEVIAEEIVLLQEEFAGYSPARILEQDATRFHLLMEGPDVDLLLSLGFEPDAPEQLRCFEISD